MKPICYIAGASPETGEEIPFTPEEHDLVIAADGGFALLQRMGVRCDLALGDFDSYEKPDFPSVITLNPCKDDTDTLYAVKEGLKRGYTDFRLYGVLGGALSHTVASLQTLTFLLDHGARGFLIGNGVCATAIRNGRIDFKAGCRGGFSVFSFDETSKGVFIQGGKFPLSDYSMTNGFPIGVSNEFTEEKLSISVCSGTLHIIFEANGGPGQAVYGC